MWIQNNYGYQLTRSIDETSIVVASVNVCWKWMQKRFFVIDMVSWKMMNWNVRKLSVLFSVKRDLDPPPPNPWNQQN